MPSFREPFTVHSYDVDAFGILAVPALAGYLQEAAGLHAAALGVGLDALSPKGLTWVLARQRLEIPGVIRLGDELVVETWPAGLDRLAATRDFVVRRADVEVARATTQWFVLDVATRRPVRPDGVLDPRLPRERSAPSPVSLAPGKLPELAQWEHQRRFHVRYQDIDVNLHVNNVSYVAWALEAIPRDLWQGSRLDAVEVHFLAECAYGSAILSRLVRRGERDLAHAIVREEDERELARLTTSWAKREG